MGAGSILRSLRLARPVVCRAIDDIPLTGFRSRRERPSLDRGPFLTGCSPARANDTEFARDRSLLPRLIGLAHSYTSYVGHGPSVRRHQHKGD